MENEIKKLVNKSEAEIEKNSQSKNSVGNRPHFPMFLFFNDAFGLEDFESISSKIERVWPQSIQHLIKFKYSKNDNIFSFYNFENDSKVVSEQTLLDSIDRVQYEHDTFADMNKLLLYNIVDTSNCKNIEDFKSYYYAINYLEELIDCNKKSMLIVLLNDSLSNRSVANEIREFLSKENIYDSILLISTRTRNNMSFKISDLYRIVSDVLVISNNDSISKLDDDDYITRFSMLYNKSIYIVSYILCEKPNRKIAIKINDIVINYTRKYIESLSKNDISVWLRKLNFENNKSDILEKYISSMCIEINEDLFEYLPMRDNITKNNINIRNCKYNDFSKYTYLDVLSSFLNEYYINNINEEDILPCYNEFEKFICDNIPIVELINLNDDSIDKIFEHLNIGVDNENLLLCDYFRRQIEIKFRKNIIIPKFKSILKKLRDNSINVINNIKELQNEYQRIIPLNDDDIGTMYKLLTENYFRGPKSNNSLMKICSPSNNLNDIVSEIFNCFIDILNENQNLFSLPFIEEWERRLELTGDKIYRKISSTLTDKEYDLIRLHGNYPIDIKFKVYMLHTSDYNGENCTELYQHLKETFKDDKSVQYFNTGYDDALEAISFIECRGHNLML